MGFVSKISEMKYPNLFLNNPPILILSTLVFVVILFKWFKTQQRQKKLPPGPSKLPIIGNLHHLSAGKSNLPPHYTLTDLAKKHGPVMQLKVGEVLNVVVSSPEATEEVCKTQDLLFAQRQPTYAFQITSFNNSSIAFVPYGNYWRQMRKLCVTELLSQKRVHSFQAVRQEEVWNLIRFISSLKGQPLNLGQKIYSLKNNIASRAVVGKQVKEGDEFIDLVKEISLLAGGFDFPDLFPSFKFLNSFTGTKSKLVKLQRKMDKILSTLLEEHRLNIKNSNTNITHTEDLTDVLIKLQESRELGFDITVDMIKAMMKDMTAAGTETTASTTEWAMSQLIRNPRVMKKAQAEVRQALQGKNKIHETDIQNFVYLKNVIKETLRLHPPAPLHTREAREDCEISGYHIPKGTKIIINAWAIGRDPKIWVDADKFLPERFEGNSIDFRGSDFELVPFGAGRRMCPGINFAMASIELVLAQLLYHFDWQLPDGMKPEELDMDETFGLVSARKNDLNVIPIPCIPFVDA
ncbi:Cytochrome P450 [Quillaja saponaria]|uniref:Cytochrome P450 n=1 Tax=Quillaja saponaria TaxID=32244 RepID=A0AAD7M3C4_QUISA|nr:Cytochrome P450 [Quillaja saponaria]KAJ7969217.1 Cytochrome P450 [Quillaja saponaria]